MSLPLLLVLALTFLVTFIGTLGYAVRIVGVRTGRIAVSFALFNILVLASRMAINIQTPLLSGYVKNGSPPEVLRTFWEVIVIAGCASVAGAFAIPTFQRIFTRAVESFVVSRSVSRVVMHGFSRTGIRLFRDSIRIPNTGNLTELTARRFPLRIFFGNVVAVAVFTISALAPLYAASIMPDLGVICLSLSGIINGLATLLLFLLIDPWLSMLTDDVMMGECSQADFRASVVAMVGSKVVGTFASLFLLVPAAHVVVFAARIVESAFSG